jgi:hypothetical protein
LLGLTLLRHLPQLKSDPAKRATLWLLAAPAAIVLVQFVALAAGKSAEYGRFALLPDTVLCLVAFTAFWHLAARSRPAAYALLVSCVLPPLVWGGVYLAHFVADTSRATTRLVEAVRLREMQEGTGMMRLAVVAEPAPYVMPPVNLWTWTLELLPRGQAPEESARAAGAEVLLRFVDDVPRTIPPGFRRLPPPGDTWLYDWPARISWAAKPFDVLVAERPRVSGGGGSAGGAATSPSRTSGPP